VTGITIDDVSTRDIDDAIWTTVRDDGFTIYVSIIDVAESVLPQSDEYVRARERVVTRYFATGNQPMLGRVLSEDLLSLWPKKERPMISLSQVTSMKVRPPPPISLG